MFTSMDYKGLAGETFIIFILLMPVLFSLQLIFFEYKLYRVREKIRPRDDRGL